MPSFNGMMTNDPLDSFGSRVVVEVPGLQALPRLVRKNGFEHHVAMNASHSAAVLAEAFETYLGWDVHRQKPGRTPGWPSQRGESAREGCDVPVHCAGS
jgi:hypothetical protein